MRSASDEKNWSRCSESPITSIHFPQQRIPKNAPSPYFPGLLGKLIPVPKKHSFSTIFPSLNLKRSVFRNNLPSVVQPLYNTKATSPSIITFSKSNLLVLLAFGQHLSLYSFKLIWSSPAGLVKVNPSTRIISNICQSFFS